MPLAQCPTLHLHKRYINAVTISEISCIESIRYILQAGTHSASFSAALGDRGYGFSTSQ